MISNDPSLDYLIERFAQRSGIQVSLVQAVPSAVQVGASLKPAAILFPSIESLESAQALIAGLAGSEIPIMVFSSVAEEARARELGADHCLFHPLTYESFFSALAEANVIHEEESV